MFVRPNQRTFYTNSPSNRMEKVMNKKYLILIASFFIIATLYLLPGYIRNGEVGHSLLRETFPEKFRIAIIADLDKLSKKKDDKGKDSWHSIYQTGTLLRDNNRYTLSWDEPADLSTAHNEAGRGCELSELVRYNGGLYSFDDRTGIMFEITNPESSVVQGNKSPSLIPRKIFMEGDGLTDKGQKFEWATVKDGLLYAGSFGKEYTDNDGNILHSKNLWIIVQDKEGRAQHIDWTDSFQHMRAELGYSHPGYMIHEAIMWSPHHKRWFIFPRRMSTERYDDVADEKRGANTLITASADFSDFKTTKIGKLTPERGFSSVKFLPGSKDTVIIALKSAEEASLDRQTSYIVMYGLNENNEWVTLMEETEVAGEVKFEGIEIIGWT